MRRPVNCTPWLLLVAGVLCFQLTACSDNDPEDTNTGSSDDLTSADSQDAGEVDVITTDSHDAIETGHPDAVVDADTRPADLPVDSEPDGDVLDTSDRAPGDAIDDPEAEMMTTDSAGFDWGDFSWDDVADAPTGDDPGMYIPYVYVRIDDTEDPALTEATNTSGVDIYGVQLVREGDSSLDASSIHVCAFGGGDNTHATDCIQVLGEPTGTCSTTEVADYVSLAGEGGSLVVSFPGLTEIVNGDTIRVLECGEDENAAEADERFSLFLGVDTDPADSNWVECGERFRGSEDCLVEGLELVER